MLKKLKREAKGAGVPERKNTAKMATKTMPVPQKITLLMRQHIGAPCTPVVAKGDKVNVGSLVGKADKGLGANIYSGVSGEVTGVEKVLDTSGTLVEAVVIQTDGLQTVDPAVVPPAVRDRESFIEAVKMSGLVGLGGAGFPTAVKLTPPPSDKIDVLIINAAECEPYITSDDREMLECSDTILTGIAAVQKYLDIPKAYIGIERNKPQAMDLMFSLTQEDDSLSVFPLPSRYPQGAEKVLIEKVTGREVPAGGLPSNVGVLVLNVCTVSGIGKFLATGMPLTTKRLTVDGGAIAQPQNVEAVIGASMQDIIEFCGGYKEEPAKVLMGGPMMGIAMADTNFPIVKQNNAVLAFTKKEAALPAPQACIRCGRCVAACPIGLSPIEITEAYENRDRDRLEQLDADICMACGACSFVCPAARLVAQTTNLARGYYHKVLKGAKQ